MSKIKFKVFNCKSNEIGSYVNCSIAIDGGIQSFGKDGVIEGTLKNTHLQPILYAGKNDIDGNEIYEGFIVKRESELSGEEDLVGEVEFDECSWWITNHKKKVSVPLFSETAVDRIIGNIYQDIKLAEDIGTYWV